MNYSLRGNQFKLVQGTQAIGEKKNALKQAVIKGESPLKLWEVNPSNLRL